MNISAVKALFKKEISDIFRDKKTLFMMIVIPLVLYPLMIVGMTLLFSTIIANQEETVYKVAFCDVPAKEEFQRVLDDEKDDLTYKVEIVESKHPEKELEEGKIHAYVKYKPAKDGKEGFVTDEKGVVYLNGQLLVTYYDADQTSSAARKAVEDLINQYQDNLRKRNLETLKLGEDALLYPVKYKTAGISSVEENIGSSLGQMIPMMIIISIMLGAIYPAIDVTAGEKERGTLETLLTLPVSNFEMITSKFLAVSVIACVSALLNMISMSGACIFMVKTLAEGESFHVDVASFLPAALLTVVVMLAFALFVTAVCLCVCVFAKSFKEANNYSTPIMLVFMFGSFVTMVPKIELDAKTALIPIVNVSLLIKKLFSFKYDYTLIAIVLLMNIIYALLTVMILGRIYNSESVLFSEGLGSVKLIRPRSSMKKGQFPGIGDAVFMSCISLLLMLYLGMAASAKMGIWSVFVTQGILLFVPLLYGWYIKTDFRALYQFRIPKGKHVLGCFALWIGTFIGIMMLSYPLSQMRTMKESAQAVEEVFAAYMDQPFWVILLMLALMPAIVEECFFRGFLFGTLRNRLRPVVAILIASAVFGIYHMSLIKFFTTSLLGLAFVYAAYRSKSIFCSMLMHFCNNGISLFVSKYADKIEKLPFIDATAKATWIDFVVFGLAAVCFIALGVWLLREKRDKMVEES